MIEALRHHEDELIDDEPAEDTPDEAASDLLDAADDDLLIPFDDLDSLYHEENRKRWIER